MTIRLAVFMLCTTSLSFGQSMKIERSGYEPEIKTNLMVATVVTNPNIHYLLTCSPDRNDCELLLAGERYEFTPAPERVYPAGPNLATHGDGKRIVVLVAATLSEILAEGADSEAILLINSSGRATGATRR